MMQAIRRWVAPAIPRGTKNAITAICDQLEAFGYRWERQTPPPHGIKARTVIDRGRRHNLSVLVETGTCVGEMARKCSGHFKEIWTIELSESLAKEAGKRLRKYRNVHVLQGESCEQLPKVLRGINGPAVFWLDAHYSGGVTAKGLKECPLESELQIIAEHECHDHILLIDDVRLMGAGDYPSLERISELAHRINPHYKVEVRDDILRCEPQKHYRD
jgi:hypothetical protein